MAKCCVFVSFLRRLTFRIRHLSSSDASRAFVPQYQADACPHTARTHSEARNARALGEATFVDPEAMTVESCVSFCSTKGLNFAGLEFGQECCTCRDRASEMT